MILNVLILRKLRITGSPCFYFVSWGTACSSLPNKSDTHDFIRENQGNDSISYYSTLIHAYIVPTQWFRQTICTALLSIQTTID